MKLSFSTLVLAASLGVTSLAHASSITSATVYTGTPDAGDASDPKNETMATASANFTIGAQGINYRSELTGYTVGAFLNSPTFSSATPGFSSTGTANNIELVIKGFITLNAGANSFVVGHDDGAILNIAGFGNVVNAPGGTSFSMSPFTVNAMSAGNYAFTLDYAECCGAPADLVFAINNSTIGASTPEPSSLLLLGSGIATTAAFMRRRLVRKA